MRIITTVAVALAIGLSSTGCTEPSTDHGRALVEGGEPSLPPSVPEAFDAAPSGGDRFETFPAPASERPTALGSEEVNASLDYLQRRFSRIGRDSLLVVRARVQSVAVVERSLPVELQWDPGTHVTSRFQALVVETLCGRNSSGIVASYVGGVAPDGTEHRNSFMPVDLVPGDEGVFVFRRIGSEWFLALGARDILSVAEGSELRTFFGETLTRDQVREVCP
jgi:hypothetical protein